MFKNCYQLKSIYLNEATSESLGTMHQMFYNCNNLIYLNIFKMVEDVQSIAEILHGTPSNLQLCVNDEKNIPKIFDIIFLRQFSTRDCTTNCYDIERAYASITKQCCAVALYNGRCYNKCPGRMWNNGNIECSPLSCQIYNYEQDNCQPNGIVPPHYFLNDSSLGTIDKCAPNCATCTIRSTKCLTCYNTKPYLYLSKCQSSCQNGSFYDNNNILKCKCYDPKCFYCSEESMLFGLCETCNINLGYYQKSDEIFDNGFINCYKDPEGYYFDNLNSIYKPCYHSCKFCYKMGNKTHHYCKSCNSKNSYPFKMEENENYLNCYPNCTLIFILIIILIIHVGIQLDVLILLLY